MLRFQLKENIFPHFDPNLEGGFDKKRKKKKKRKKENNNYSEIKKKSRKVDQIQLKHANMKTSLFFVQSADSESGKRRKSAVKKTSSNAPAAVTCKNVGDLLSRVALLISKQRQSDTLIVLLYMLRLSCLFRLFVYSCVCLFVCLRLCVCVCVCNCVYV